MMMIRDFYRFPKISDRFLIDIYRFHGMSWYFYGSYFLTIRKARFLVTSPDSPRALDWEHNDMAELPKIKNHIWVIWFWGWELVRIIMMFFSSCCWKKIHCNLKSDQSQKPAVPGSRWNRQTYCSLEFSLRDLARPLHLQPYMSKISISNRFKQKILQTCCAWTWEELFDINNSGLVDFIPLLWDV